MSFDQERESEHAACEEEIHALRKERDELLELENILVLCGEDECRDVRGCPEKLRALIDGLISAKKEAGHIKRDRDSLQSKLTESQAEVERLREQLFLWPLKCVERERAAFERVAELMQRAGDNAAAAAIRLAFISSAKQEQV